MPRNKFGLEALLINLDPWLKREELYETYKAVNKIKHELLACGQSSYIWSSGLSRVWIPHPGTEMYKIALKENLLIENKTSKFPEVLEKCFREFAT